MNQLIVKEVEFNGGHILGVQAPNGKVYMGVRKACSEIGLTFDQATAQVKKIQGDMVLSKGSSNLTIPTKGGSQEALGIELDFVPLWLAKISITPTMQKESPEVVDRLVQYQLQAKDVLAAAFLGKQKIKPTSEMREKEIEARLKNANVRQANILLKIAEKIELAKESKQVLYSHATALVAGTPLIPLPVSEKRTYTATEIGERLGMSSNMVGKIAKAHNLKIAQYGKWFYDKSRHSNKEVESFRYYEEVIPAIQSIIERGC